MTTEFDNAVEAIAQAQATPEAVRAAQAELAPVRARALAALDEFHATVARLRPFFDAAMEKHNRACDVGVSHPELRHTLDQALQSMTGGLNSIMGIVSEIDGLTAYTVYQGHHRSLPGRLVTSSANIGYLAELAKRAAAQLVELEERVTREARDVPAVGAKYYFPERHEVVDAAFDPRAKPGR